MLFATTTTTLKTLPKIRWCNWTKCIK